MRRDRWTAWRGVAAAMAAMAAMAGAPAAEAGLPADVDAFRERIEREATTPEGALHLYFEALFVYQSDDAERREQGAQMLDLISVDDSWRRNNVFRAQLENKPYIFRSYCRGAEPDNGYRMDPESFDLRIERAEDAGEECRIDLRSSGTDELRPATLRRIESAWRMADYGNLYAGVQPPARTD